MRAAEILEQLLIGRRLLERVELRAVEVLKQRIPKQVLVGRVPDDGSDRLQSGFATSPPATLPHDELEPILADLANDDRLQEANLLDGVDELRQVVLIEDLARLARVRDDLVEWQLSEPGTLDFLQARSLGLGRIRWDQCFKASAQPTSRAHQADSP